VYKNVKKCLVFFCVCSAIGKYEISFCRLPPTRCMQQWRQSSGKYARTPAANGQGGVQMGL